MKNMTHLGLENDLTPPEHLVAMSALWHYGWSWSGSEPLCGCPRAPCGLLEKVRPPCDTHDGSYGTARQLHRASACPGPRT